MDHHHFEASTLWRLQVEWKIASQAGSQMKVIKVCHKNQMQLTRFDLAHQRIMICSETPCWERNLLRHLQNKIPSLCFRLEKVEIDPLYIKDFFKRQDGHGTFKRNERMLEQCNFDLEQSITNSKWARFRSRSITSSIDCAENGNLYSAWSISKTWKNLCNSVDFESLTVENTWSLQNFSSILREKKRFFLSDQNRWRRRTYSPTYCVK